MSTDANCGLQIVLARIIVADEAMDLTVTMNGKCLIRVEFMPEPTASPRSDVDRILSGKLQKVVDGVQTPSGLFVYRIQGTDFQKSVWSETAKIPFGATATYGEIARRIGCGSPRAVGQALGANPLPIIIPCHRVVGAGGRLTGFSAGLETKRLLLRHEHENCCG